MTDILMARSGGTAVITSLVPTAAPTRTALLNRARVARRALAGVNTAAAVAAEPVEERARHATIAAVIPCYNEQDSIEAVLKSLLGQTRLPDVIHVVVNNTDDDTIEIANRYLGEHRRTVKGVEFRTVVHVHDMGVNPDKKVGALNYGFRMARNYDFILGVDGDTTLERKAVEYLEMEMVDDPRIGGLSAIYTVDHDAADGPMSKFLLAGQRAQFAGFNLDNLLRGRNMAVLGGQCSLFSVLALEGVMHHYHQNTPWVRDSEVEDSLLSLQIKKVGFSTKISSRARASVGGMPNLRALHSQQVKWNYGGIDLMWPGQRGNTKGQPLHPNLRLRWFENFTKAMNVLTRLAGSPRLRVQPDLADPAGGRRDAQPASRAGHEDQAGHRHRLRVAAVPGRVLHVDPHGSLHRGVGPVLRPGREGQLGRAGQRREGPRLEPPLAGVHRGHRLRGADLRLDEADERRAVGDPVPRLAGALSDHDPADAVHAEEADPAPPGLHRLI
jgi:hypothetical protein